jgi:hypothetical protein
MTTRRNKTRKGNQMSGKRPGVNLAWLEWTSQDEDPFLPDEELPPQMREALREREAA